MEIYISFVSGIISSRSSSSEGETDWLVNHGNVVLIHCSGLLVRGQGLVNSLPDSWNHLLQTAMEKTQIDCQQLYAK